MQIPTEDLKHYRNETTATSDKVIRELVEALEDIYKFIPENHQGYIAKKALAQAREYLNK